MRITGLLAIVLLGGALLPATAIAQPSPADLTYCNRLADSYYRYIGRSEASPIDDVRRGSLDTQVAAAQCREGKTAQAIPVLERVLRNNGFTLPPRG
jgi:hypothetical protein